MRSVISVEGPESVSEVTTTGIRMFARAVGHTDLIFYDEDEAKQRGYRGLVAPPGFLGTGIFRPDGQRAASGDGTSFRNPYKRILDGGTRLEYLAPVIAGDVISSRTKITEFREREGSIGPMLITYRETTSRNQDGAVVARRYGNVISY
jgi:acyl dehydratase